MKRPLPERIIDMRVRDVMTADVRCCTPDTPLPEVANLMREHDCGALPVVDKIANKSSGKVMGMITDRDIVCRVIAKGSDVTSLTAASCMSTPVVTVQADETLANCCRLMEQKRVRRVPVVDEGGRCCGIVSQADIARHAPEARTGDLVQEISKPAA
jgi:CBS domain-containing protein